MKKRFSTPSFNTVLQELSQHYILYAPKTFKGEGMFSDLDLVRYAKINALEEANFKDKSFYSPKEVINPPSQPLFYFNEETFTEPQGTEKPALVFLHHCDLFAFDKLDTIYLHNQFTDKYYAEAKNKTKFVVVGCKTGWDSCFCVSMGTNVSNHYDIAINLEEDGTVLTHIQDTSLQSFFSDGEESMFEVDYVRENKEKVHVAKDITLKEVAELPLWRDYDRCIACGRCNFVCPTCSCYSTQDVFYKDNPSHGERRRVWASCHVDGFTKMAGGHEFRKRTGDRMRFRVMHKIADFTRRFGSPMCIGCGRCDDACPEYISHINCINRLSAEVEQKRSEAHHG